MPNLILTLLIVLAVVLNVGFAGLLLYELLARKDPDRFRLRSDDDGFALRKSKSMFRICVGMAGFCAALATVLWVFVDDFVARLMVFFLFGFALFFLFAALDAVRWRLTVRDGALTVAHVFRPASTIRVDDISFVRAILGGFAVYINGKRVLSLDMLVDGANLLYAYLREAGKLESTQRQNAFTVRQRKADAVVCGICAPFFAGGLIAALLLPEEPLPLFVYLIFGGFFVFSLGYVFYNRRWKIEVRGDDIFVRPGFARGKAYSIRALTRVEIDNRKHRLTLFADGVKIATVLLACLGCDTLLERIGSEGIQIWVDGKPAAR